MSTRAFEDEFTQYRGAKARYTDFISIIGSLMYLAMLKEVVHETDQLIPCLGVVLLGILCLWPALLSSYNMTLFSKHRDNIFMVHFILHHGLVPHLIGRYINLGSRFSPGVVPFLAAFFLLRSSLIYHIIDPLVYRIHYVKFLLVQPFILAVVAPLEWGVCDQFCQKGSPFEKIAGNVFGSMAHSFRIVHTLVNPFLSKDIQQGEPCSECCLKVHTYLFIVIGLVIPAFILWRLERHAKREFLISLLRNPHNASQCGISRSELVQVMKNMRIQREDLLMIKSKYMSFDELDVSWAGFVILCSSFLWTAIEAVY